jgi:tetratricopeptide (TPR) repeat protein
VSARPERATDRASRGGGTRALLVALALVALGGAVGLQAARDAAWPRDEAARARTEWLYVQSPEAVKRLAPGFSALAADVYWIRAIQHFGGQRLSDAPPDYSLLFPLLDITTTLDPYFSIAYRFGAIFLSEPYPGGPGRPDLAIQLLEKGIAAQPTRWQYHHDLAFVHYWHTRDYQAAAEWFQRASEQPDAPLWLAPMVPVMLTRAEDRNSARMIWHQILQSEQQWLQRTAERSLLQLDALDAMDILQALVNRHPPAAGEPYSWQGLARRGAIRRMPLDPAGVPFDLDPETGVVTVARRSPLFPLPVENRPR